MPAIRDLGICRRARPVDPFVPHAQDDRRAISGAVNELCLELSASSGVAVAISGTRGRRATRGAIVAPDGRDLTPRLGAHLRPEPAPHLVRAIGQAFALHEELLATGDEVNVVARRLGLHPGRAHHLLHLTRLSPDVIRAVLTGTIGRRIALTDLHAAADHIEWTTQHEHLRLPATHD